MRAQARSVARVPVVEIGDCDPCLLHEGLVLDVREPGKEINDLKRVHKET